jgi:hypothetical protein
MKFKSQITYCLSLIFYLMSLCLSAQQAIFVTDSTYKKSTDRLLLDEKVFLITDRETYFSGEEILFNAFTYEATWFLPIGLNPVLYVELYSQNNKVISRAKYYLKNGSGSGYISIPREVSTGIYFIRAYTNWMKNFGFSQFSTLKLKILNPFVPFEAAAKETPPKKNIKCEVFPEGGKLIYGVFSKVSCRFTDGENHAKNVSAVIMQDDNHILASFKTLKNGYGIFNYQPVSGNNCFILAECNDTIIKIPLPEISASGISVSVDTITSDNVYIKVRSSNYNNYPVKLTASHNGFDYQTTVVTDKDSIYKIPVMYLPTGLIHLKLTDTYSVILSSRTIYLDPVKSFGIKLETEKEKYNNREKIEVSINTKHEKRVPDISNLTVYSFLSENDKPDMNIDNFRVIFLRQELMKYIFDNPDLLYSASSDRKLLEMLLLSFPDKDQYNFDRIAIKYIPELSGDMISGTLNYMDGRYAEGLKVLQSYNGETRLPESAFTDRNGRFNIFLDKTKHDGDLILKAQNTKTEVSLMLDNEFYDDFPPPSELKIQLTENEKRLISKQFINIQIDDAFAFEKSKSISSGDNNLPAFYGEEFTEYKFSDYARLPNMKEFISEIIVGVILMRDNKSENIRILEERTSDIIGTDPLVLIDGVPASSANVVNLPPEKVDRVRVVRHRYFYKDLVFDGIMDIRTFNNDAWQSGLPEGTFRFKFISAVDGSVKIESEVRNNLSGRIPVYKNLLYWNPSITTDKEGNAKVSFIAPDNSGTFEIRCFGFSPEGIAGEGRISIKVGK